MRATAGRLLGKQLIPIASQPCEAFVVVVNDVAIPLAINRHVWPECVAGDRTEVELSTRSRERLGNGASAIADRTMTVQITPI